MIGGGWCSYDVGKIYWIDLIIQIKGGGETKLCVIYSEIFCGGPGVRSETKTAKKEEGENKVILLFFHEMYLIYWPCL